MHGFGRTLRQAGDLRLLALPVEVRGERYCVVDGGTPLATFAAAAPAVAFFRALRAAGTEAARPPPAGPGRVTDLAAYRRRRAGRAAGRPGVPAEPGGPEAEVGEVGETERDSGPPAGVPPSPPEPRNSRVASGRNRPPGNRGHPATDSEPPWVTS